MITQEYISPFQIEKWESTFTSWCKLASNTSVMARINSFYLKHASEKFARTCIRKVTHKAFHYVGQKRCQIHFLYIWHRCPTLPSRCQTKYSGHRCLYLLRCHIPWGNKLSSSLYFPKQSHRRRLRLKLIYYYFIRMCCQVLVDAKYSTLCEGC